MSTQVSTPAKRPTGEILFALVFVSVGAAGLLAAGSIPVPPSETGIGPRAFPYHVCTMLVLVGTGIVAQVGASNANVVAAFAAFDRLLGTLQFR